MKVKTFEKLSLLVYALFTLLPPIAVILLILSLTIPEVYHITKIIMLSITGILLILLIIFWISPVELEESKNR